MKTALSVLLMLFLLTAVAAAADVKLAWDPPTDDSWTTVRIYEINGANYSKVGEVPGTQTTITLTNVQPGRHVYVAKSYNDIWKLESADSNQAVTPNLNPAPKNLTWTVVVTVGP